MALVCFALAVGALAYLHRGDIWPAAPRPGAADDAFAACYAPRLADIERMAREGVVGPEQAALFRARAEALCRAQTRDATSSQGPAPAGLPPGLVPTPLRSR